jgi:hypothetical protein
MVEVQNESSGNTLHIVYENYNFELACYQIVVYFNYQNQNMCETNNDGMSKEPINNKMSFVKTLKNLHELFSWIIIC